MASKARLIVAIGVLNSWVILLIKSVLIWDICRCFINCDNALEYAITIISVKIMESDAIKTTEESTTFFFSVKFTNNW